MNSKSMCIIKRLIILFLLSSIISVGYYFFYYDRNKSQTYQPDVDALMLQSAIEKLEPIQSNVNIETRMNQNGFKALIVIDAQIDDVQDIIEYFDYIIGYRYPHGERFNFKDNTSEIIIWDAEYTPLVKALGYGWYNDEGNLYARWNGKEKAADKPNYRNHFRFNIRKNDEQFYFDIYCNTSSVQKALSEVINYYNNVNE